MLRIAPSSVPPLLSAGRDDANGVPDPVAVLRTYERERERWEREALGQFVAISGDEALGPYSTLRTALTCGRERFGAAPVSVLRIGEPHRTGEMI